MQEVSSVPLEPYDSPGLGRDVRIEGESVAGAALVVDGFPVHVELFPNDHWSRSFADKPENQEDPLLTS
jgi:hypothetical protein